MEQSDKLRHFASQDPLSACPKMAESNSVSQETADFIASGGTIRKCEFEDNNRINANRTRKEAIADEMQRKDRYFKLLRGEA